MKILFYSMRYLFICALIVMVVCSFKVEHTFFNGEYKSVDDREILILKQNGNFILINNLSHNQDMYVPSCDTLATGQWVQFRKNVLMLNNNSEALMNIDVKFIEEKRFSNDSVYFEVDIPRESAFSIDPNRFQYSFYFFGGLSSPIETTKSIVTIPKNKFPHSQYAAAYPDFNLSIQDLHPASDKQRIYFPIFEQKRISSDTANYFKIELRNFTQCFVETNIIDHQFLVFDTDGIIYWRGKKFIKQ